MASRSAPNPVAGRHFSGLDGLRGVAILAVLFHHLNLSTPVDWLGARYGSILEFAAHGVDLFFVLSGFLIVDQLSRGAGTGGFARKFWLRRVAKIMPLYFAAVIGIFALLKPVLIYLHVSSKLRWLQSTSGNWPWYAAFGSNFKNALDGKFTNPGLDVCWSLAIEVQFYVLVFLLARIVARAHWVRLAMGVIGAALLFRGAEIALGANWIQILVITPGRLDDFAFGALVALARPSLARISGWLVIAVAAVPLMCDWSRARMSVELIGYTAVGAAAAILVERASRTERVPRYIEWIACRPLIFLGRISYSIYLIHLPLRAVIRDRLLPGERLLRTPLDWLLQGAFTVGVSLGCIFVGWLTWRLIEEPARKFILKVCDQPKARAVP